MLLRTIRINAIPFPGIILYYGASRLYFFRSCCRRSDHDRRRRPQGQVYNLAIDAKTQKPYATVSYSVHRGGDIIFNQIETTADMKESGQQITLEKRLGLGALKPGEYKLNITITDWVQNATVTASSAFHVVP